MRWIALTLCLSSTVSAAQDVSESDAFVVNNILHVLYHEAGHAVIDQFNLPVIGQEEDAADSFATLEVLDLYEDPFFVLLDSAEANFLMQDEVDLEDQANYFDSHDLDIQRAYRIACVAVGTDAEKYGEIAEWAELPEERQDTCIDDADLAWQSWDSFRGQIGKPEGGTPTPITLSFKDEGAFFAEKELLKKYNVMEEFREYLTVQFAWPQPVKLTVEQCGEANAYYDPENVTITMCYEMVEFMGKLESRRD